MYKIDKLKKVLGEKLQEHVVLRSYTTMKVGGVADYFFEAKNVSDLMEAVLAARADKIPYFMLGGGSNVIVSDYGYSGLIIRNCSSNISVVRDKSQIIADSGANFGSVILKAVDNSLGGLEPLFGIYGSIGGAIYGNAEAYGTRIFDFVKSVTVLNSQDKIVSYGADWFEPEYRSTKLKKEKSFRSTHSMNSVQASSGQEKSDCIILTVRLQLAHNKREQLLENINKIKTLRDEKFSELGPSCGSIFRNPSNIETYKNPDEAKKNSIGYILDQLEVKKCKVGGAGVYKKHANIIENQNNAKAIDIRNLIENIREKARSEKGIVLEEEVEYLGQWE